MTETAWESRIIGFDPAVEVDQLLAHPLNARRHRGPQRDAIRASFDRVGMVDAMKVNQRTGRMLDGHMRVEEVLSRGGTVPVLYLDLDEDEERFVLATLDPITGMATYDTEVFEALTEDLDVGDTLQGLLDQITDTAQPLPPIDDQPPIPEPGEPGAGGGDTLCSHCPYLE